jgi:hypothetical protein
MQSRDTVVAVFDDRSDAQDAINALRDAGFMADDISILARDRDTAGRLAEDTGAEVAAGAATGALAGGLLGGVAGWLIGIGALAIPGIGPIVAAGPLAAALGGAAIGATGGGVIGALTGVGVPEDEARYYDTEFKRGGIVVTAQARGRYDEARAIMRENGGRDTESSTATYATWDTTAPRMRNSYEQRYGASRAWNDVEPAHRFGYESYGRTRTADTHTDWGTAEPTLREEWTRTNRTGDWDAHRNDVRRGWDYGRGRTTFREYDRDDDLGTEGENATATGGGAVAGGVAGGAAGAVVGGPLGAAAGAVIGGTAGAMAGDAAVKTPREKAEDIEDDRRDRMDDTRRRR